MLVQRLCDMKQGYTQFGGESCMIEALLGVRNGTRFLDSLRPDHGSHFSLPWSRWVDSADTVPGLRPFGVALLYMGWDPLHGFQLYQSDPSGNYSGWKATCIGANHSSATSLLKQDYKDDLSLEDARQLCLKVMSKTMDSTKLGSEKRE